MIEVVLVLAVLGVLTSCQSGEKEISQETTRSMSGAAAAGESEAGAAVGENDAAGGESEADTAAGKDAAGESLAVIEEEDPAAHWARSWEECMNMPSEEQMEASNGRERSPYIAFWVNYPDVEKCY